MNKNLRNTFTALSLFNQNDNCFLSESDFKIHLGKSHKQTINALIRNKFILLIKTQYKITSEGKYIQEILLNKNNS